MKSFLRTLRAEYALAASLFGYPLKNLGILILRDLVLIWACIWTVPFAISYIVALLFAYIAGGKEAVRQVVDL